MDGLLPHILKIIRIKLMITSGLLIRKRCRPHTVSNLCYRLSNGRSYKIIEVFNDSNFIGFWAIHKDTMKRVGGEG